MPAGRPAEEKKSNFRNVASAASSKTDDCNPRKIILSKNIHYQSDREDVLCVMRHCDLCIHSFFLFSVVIAGEIDDGNYLHYWLKRFFLAAGMSGDATR